MKKLILIFLQLIIVRAVYSQSSSWSDAVIISPTPPKLNCVAATFGMDGWIGGDSGTILYTSDWGANWVYRNNSTIGNYNVNVITRIQSNFAGCLCSVTSPTTSYIYRSTNQGMNWTMVYQQPNGRIIGIVVADTSIGFAIGDPVGGRWTILKTTNNGIIFDSAGLYLPQSGNETSFYNSVYFARSAYSISNTTLMFGTNNNRLYRSTNNGLSWSSIILPFQNVYSITLEEEPNDYASLEFGYAAGDGAVYTTNFGQSWTPVTLPGTGDIHAFQFSYGYACYTKGSQIYSNANSPPQFTLDYTSPNGGNYTHMSLKTFIFEGGYRRGWAVKDNGTASAYYYYIMGIKKIVSEIPDKFTLSQNYPNPFNPSTKIKFDIPLSPLNERGVGLPAEATAQAGGFVTLKIYDLLGCEIATLVNQPLKPGTYEVEWDGTNYPSGVYFYKLQTESFSDSKRMVLIK